MELVRITKEFKFEMVICSLDTMDCVNIHGHSYRLWITIRGRVRHEKGFVKDGMVLDFGNLKKIVKPLIVDKYDHSLVLNKFSTC